ncbi:MAG: EAL domain-containing protein, partial [Spirochaetales bacterium]|nr:EAL domain-containing protein [Spirochaetales bacterium]
MKDEKILIVEDERIIAIDLQRRLERFGYTVVGITSDGSDSIELAGQLSPDIVIMDIMLDGDMDGIEAATIIKKRYSIPVIFLTAYSDKETLERAKTAEPSGYILKPFKDKELYTTIDISLYKHNVDLELKRQQRLSTAILHSIGDGIIATDTKDKIIMLNPKAEKLIGLSRKESKGKTISEIIQLESMENDGTQYIQFPDGKDATIKERPFSFKNCLLTNKNGEKLQVEGTLSAITDKAGTYEGLVLTLRDMTTLNRLSEAVEYHTSHDKLTGLSNREIFSLKLEQVLSETLSSSQTFALAYIDIDRFKIVNDTCGHSIADKMLVDIAICLKEFAGNPDFCARLGGDQFGIILVDYSFDKIKENIKRLHTELSSKKLEWNSHFFNFDTSIGITALTNSSANVSAVLAEADDACFLAKEEGGNRIKVYDKKETQFLKRRGEMEWVSKLSKAISEDRFELYIQEIKPLNNNRNTYSKGEVLIRMRDEDGSVIMPADFIPAAERYNMMAQIDRWVVSNSIKYYLKNIKKGRLKHIREISINLSAPSISDGTILEYIKNDFKTTGISPREICFEITETSTISDMSAAHDFINDLKQTGCSFALDDFGSGFSSFNYLKNLPVDYLKIDGVFIKNMH